MKKIVFALILAVTAGLMAADYSITVSAGASTMVAPPRGISVAPSFTNGQAVAQGALRSYAKRIFMAVNAGTTGTNPPNANSVISNDGTVNWLAVPASNRQSLSIVAETDGPVWYQDSTSSTNGGVFTFTKGQQYSDDTDAPVYIWTTNSIKFNIKDR